MYISSTGRKGAQRDTGWTPQGLNSFTHPPTGKNLENTVTAKLHWLCEAKSIDHNGLALRSKANPLQRIGFAKQSHSDHDGKALRSKANPAKMHRLCEAKSIDQNGLALRSKANPLQRIGFAKQSQSNHDGKALRSKANQGKWIDFAKQSHSGMIKMTLKKKQIQQNEMGLQSKANPSQWIGFAKLALRSEANTTANHRLRTAF